MKMLFIFLFISLMIIIYSCNESSTDGNSDVSSLIPFKLNNSWEYEHLIYDSSGNVFADTTITQVIKDTTIFNIHFYKYDNSVIHYTTKEDGIWMYFILDTGNEEHCLYFKYPCKTGDTYPFTLGRPPAIVSILSTNQNIQVEAGTFSCILYHFEFDSLGYTNFYIAPGIGIIKNEVFEQRINSTSFKLSEERLLSYHLN